mmetsp:Transcript_42818/g.58462  ORF Transcript_42818/g.58462 Transcript_42818/m.58462 type:complete len:89 (-) Transcript_42818:41-307(-)
MMVVVIDDLGTTTAFGWFACAIRPSFWAESRATLGCSATYPANAAATTTTATATTATGQRMLCAHEQEDQGKSPPRKHLHSFVRFLRR